MWYLHHLEPTPIWQHQTKQNLAVLSHFSSKGKLKTLYKLWICIKVTLPKKHEQNYAAENWAGTK